MGKHVLVVDDDESIRQLVEAALSMQDYDVSQASDGAQALARCIEQPPDLILLDMQMPVMDGPEFAARYRERGGPHAPIVAFTASVDADASAKCMHPDAILHKPFNIEELVMVARSILH